jgi:hypothetical protein
MMKLCVEQYQQMWFDEQMQKAKSNQQALSILIMLPSKREKEAGQWQIPRRPQVNN